MKSITGLFLLLVLALQPAFAEMRFSPSAARLELAPGETGQFRYTVEETDPGFFNSMAPLWDLNPSSVEISWLTANVPIRGYITADRIEVIVDVTVPEQIPVGRYSGIIRGRTGWAHGNQEIAGVALTIDVIDVISCDATARFVDSGNETLELWVPNRTTHGVELFGEFELADGCSLLGARYTVDDEYGEWDAEGELTIDDATGSWSATPLVEASRRGQDRDGRHYRVTLTLTTEAGDATQLREIIVPHDQRPER